MQNKKLTNASTSWTTLLLLLLLLLFATQSTANRSIYLSITNQSTTILRFPQNSCLPLLPVIRKKKTQITKSLTINPNRSSTKKQKKTKNKRSNPATHHNFFFFSSSSSCLVHFETKKTPKRRINKRSANSYTASSTASSFFAATNCSGSKSIDPVTKRRRRVLIRRATEALARAPNAFPKQNV